MLSFPKTVVKMFQTCKILGKLPHIFMHNLDTEKHENLEAYPIYQRVLKQNCFFFVAL